MNTLKNLETINMLNKEIEELKNNIKKAHEKIDLNNAIISKILKEILIPSNEQFEKCVINWVLNNPVEAISYYKAKELDIDTIYYENDNKYMELFEDDIDDDMKNNCGYTLININTLKTTSVKVEDMCDYYSTMSCGSNVFLELDFINNCKMDLMLIEEDGYFNDDNNWSIEYKIVDSENCNDSIYKIIKNNFVINELELEDNEIKLSKENIESLLYEYNNELELGYNNDKTFAIYNNSNVIGFIELSIHTDLEYGNILTVNSFEIFSKYRDLGYGSKVVNYLKSTYRLRIFGYSVPSDKTVNFWSMNGAEFDSCENCEEISNCDGCGCDEPLDSCFIIPVDYM